VEAHFAKLASEHVSNTAPDIQKQNADVLELFRKAPTYINQCLLAVEYVAGLFRKPVLEFALPQTDADVASWDFQQPFPEARKLNKFEQHVLATAFAKQDRCHPDSVFKGNTPDECNKLTQDYYAVNAKKRAPLLPNAPPNPSLGMLVNGLISLRTFKERLNRGLQFYLELRYMYPNHSKETIRNMLMGPMYKYDFDAKKYLSSKAETDTLVEKLYNKWFKNARQQHYKNTREAKEVAVKKAEIEKQVQELQHKMNEIQQPLTAAKTTTTNNTTTAPPESEEERKRKLDELTTAATALREQAEQVEKEEKKLEDTLAQQAPVRKRQRKVATKKTTTTKKREMEPPVRNTNEAQFISYHQPGKDWKIDGHRKVNLLVSSGSLFKSAIKDLKSFKDVDDSLLDEVDNNMELRKEELYSQQLTESLLDLLESDEGKKLLAKKKKKKKNKAKAEHSRSDLQILAEKARLGLQNNVDYEQAFVRASTKKIVICLRLIDITEFLNEKTGEIVHNKVKPANVHASLSTWLTDKDLESLSLVCSYYRKLLAAKQYESMLKIIKKHYKGDDARMLEEMLFDIDQTLTFTNRHNSSDD